MLYNENRNIDYINMFLKRLATEDEINLLENFWKEVIPYRFLKGFYNKLSRKYFFSDRDFNKIKIKNYKLFVKSSKIEIKDNLFYLNGDCIKSFAAKGIQIDGISGIATFNSNDVFEKLSNYSLASGIPIITAQKANFDSSSNFAEIFGVSLIKKKRAGKQKIKNGLNIFIIGDLTNIENPTGFNVDIHKNLTAAGLEIRRLKLAKASQSCECGIFTAIMKLLQNQKWGLFANIDNLHKTSNDGKTWQYLTAKNNERLIYAISNKKLVEFINILDKYEIPFSIIGKIDKSKTIRVMSKGKLVINLPKKLIFNPILKINNFDYTINEFKNIPPTENLNGKLDLILKDESFLNKIPIIEHFNSEIGRKTTLPMTTAGVGELYFQKIKHYISTATVDSRLQLDYNPFATGQNMVFEAARKIISTGHTPLTISIICNINFSQKGEIKRFDEIRKGIVKTTKKLKIKILNVHIFKTEDKSSYSINIIGKRKLTEPLCDNSFHIEKTDNDNKIYLIGKPDNLYATSTYQKIIGENIYPCPDETNLKFEKKLIKCIRQLQSQKLIKACMPVDKFGIAGALLNGLRKNKLGFTPEQNGANNLSLRYLFNESQSRFLVQSNENIEIILRQSKIPFFILGKINNSGNINIGDLSFNIT